MMRRLSLPPSLSRAVGQFYEVRNRIVHGHDVTADDALRALDSGLKILSTIRSLPHEVHVVRFPAVEVYADAAGTERREIDGLVLDTRTPGGETRRDVFPTRRSYQEGQAVTWEWDLSSTWPESWYRDPNTREVVYAWSSAAEFAGRPLDEIQ
jgi:hypothetical protein